MLIPILEVVKEMYLRIALVEFKFMTFKLLQEYSLLYKNLS